MDRHSEFCIENHLQMIDSVCSYITGEEMGTFGTKVDSHGLQNWV